MSEAKQQNASSKEHAMCTTLGSRTYVITVSKNMCIPSYYIWKEPEVVIFEWWEYYGFSYFSLYAKLIFYIGSKVENC